MYLFLFVCQCNAVPYLKYSFCKICLIHFRWCWKERQKRKIDPRKRRDATDNDGEDALTSRKVDASPIVVGL